MKTEGFSQKDARLKKTLHLAPLSRADSKVGWGKYARAFSRPFWAALAATAAASSAALWWIGRRTPNGSDRGGFAEASEFVLACLFNRFTCFGLLVY